MAPVPKTSIFKLQEDIRKLNEKFNKGEIQSADYLVKLGKLENKLQFMYDQEVRATPVTEQEKRQAQYELRTALRGESPYVYKEAAKIQKAEQQGKPKGFISLDEAAVERAQEQLRRRVRPELYKTGEIGTSGGRPSWGLSTIVDPVKGLVLDSQTNEVRKATPSEFAFEALKRQIAFAPEYKIKTGPKQEKIEQLRREYKRLETELKGPRGFTGVSGISPEAARGMMEAERRRQQRKYDIPREIAQLEQEFEEDPQYAIIQEAGYMPETNLGWGFRMLMSGSATVAPIVKETQDLIGSMTGAPPSTRKGAGYQETQIDAPGMGQFLTNLATGQGVFQQMQAQLAPADTQNDGLLGFGTQGTYQSMGLSLLPELGIRITPVGVASDVARVVGKGLQVAGKARQSGKLQKAGQLISEPLESIRYHGHKAELDKALKSVDEGLSAKQIEKEIVKEGGLLSRQTLRSKTAETIGDIYGSVKALEVVIQKMKSLGESFIKLSDIKIPNSPFITNFIGKGIKVDDALVKIRPFVNQIEKAIDADIPSLRRSTDIANDTVKSIRTGVTPTFDADVINRSVRSALLRNIDWDKINLIQVDHSLGISPDQIDHYLGIVPDKNLMAIAQRTKQLLQKSQTEGLKPFELEGLGKSLKVLEDAGLGKTVGTTLLKQSPRVVYESVRNAVASVLRDNFLKNIPDDFIDIGGTVAVPLKSVQTSTGRMTPAFNRHQKQKARLLDTQAQVVGKELRYTPTKKAAESLINYTKFSGVQLPQQLLAKIEQAAQGALKATDALTGIEYQALENIISGELGIQFLNGVKLKSGTLTGELATLRGAARSTLIGPTKERGSFAIQLQGMVNAVKQLRGGKQGIAANVYNKMFAKEMLPVPLYRLQSEIRIAQEASFKQVRSRLENEVRQAATPQAKVEAYHKTIEEYVQLDVAQQLGRAEDMATRQRMGVAPELRQQTVGQVEGLKAQQQEKLQQFTQKKRQQLNKIQQNKLEQIQKKETLYAERIAKTQSKGTQSVQKLEDSLLSNQLKRIERRYENRKITLEANRNKLLDKLDDKLDEKLEKLQFKDSKFVAENKKIQAQRNKLQSAYNVQAQKIENRYQKKLKEADKKYGPLIKDAQDKLARRNLTPQQKKRIDLKEEEIRNRIARVKKDTDELLDRLKRKKQEEILRINDEIEDQVSRLQATTTERVTREEAKQERKSKQFARERKLSQLSEKYGRKNVNDFLKQQGIGESYDDLMTVIDDVEANMQQYVNSIYRAQLWENIIKKVFTKPVTKWVQPLRDIDDIDPNIFRDVIRKDTNKAFYEPDNVLAFTPANVEAVINNIKTQIPYLKPYGLRAGLVGEDFNYPLIEMMNDIQRTQNVDRAIKQFMLEQPDMLINLNRMNQGTPGLENVEAMSGLLENEINMLLRFSVNQGKVTQLQVDTLLDTIKEILFDGVMKDVWRLSGRDQQRKFLNGYLGQMVKNGSTNVDMSQYLTNLVNNGILKTNTFENIQNRSLRILARFKDKITRVDIPDVKAQKLLDDAIKELPEVITRLQKEYLLQMIGSAEGKSTGIFGQQMMYLHNYMSRFGLSEDILANNLRNMKPTIDYLGKTNMALLYGDITSDLIPRIMTRFKEAAFSERLQQMATRMQPVTSAGYNVLYAADYLLSQARRLSTANMLYGIGLPTTRFLGFNRLTAPVIWGATIGYGGTNLKQAIKFTGLSAGMGLASLADRVLVKNRGYKGWFDSTRYLHAPDDEIIIFANKSNAGRNYTAKELRDLTDTYGIQYSRSSIEFYDQEYKELLDLVGIKPDGTMKGVPAKIVDVLNPTKTNYLARIAMVQDAELRQFVFVESLKEGATVKQAADLAKRSMLDYTSLSSFERQYIARYIYFYAFMRTMGVETLNSFARGGTAPRVLRAQNSLAQAMAEDVVGYTDDQRGRMFNIFAGSVDKKDIYLSGPPNPLMQMFDLMSTSALLSMNIATDISGTGRKDMIYEDVLFDAILSSGLKTAESNPLFDTLFERIRAASGGRRIRQFPSELIFAAEQQGMLDEVIQMYDLVEMNYVSPARPMTLGKDGEPGKYYTFRKGTAGNKGYMRYLKHRLIGMASFSLAVELGLQQTPYYGAMTRNWRDYYKAQMLATPRGTKVPTFKYVVPYREQQPVGQRTIPTTARYLKGATIQKDLPVDVDIDVTELREGLWGLYMLGLVTPTKAKDKDRVIMRNLQDGLRLLNDLEKSAN